ncbi:MAG: oxidoreductase [Flavobacteriales bacterium]|nr:oxidoreductase [Flavobacteriales bacterium]|tara:strand:+ start:3272 stop:3967 length:696 start_codon:yes stop_codon:yes gene_type:complete
MNTKVSNTKGQLSATIFGSTGLIGGFLADLLAEDKDFSKVYLANRREIEIPNNPTIEQKIVDFDKLEQYPELFSVDVTFVCLGTTMKTAGSKEAFEKVDKHLVHKIAQMAKEHACPKLLMISSLGADSKSNNFYLKTKGEAEDLVRKDGPEQLSILRPSLLLGERSEFRFGELIAQKLMPIFSFLLVGGLRKYRPIKARDVAKAMQILSKEEKDHKVYQSNQIKTLVEQHK